jgi:hypothetical protein
MNSHKVEVKEYTFENGQKIYTLVEKRYVLGIRLIKEEHAGQFTSLKNAKEAAKRISAAIEKENMIGLVSSKTVYVVGEGE